MFRTKSALTLFMLLILSLALVACGGAEEEPADPGSSSSEAEPAAEPESEPEPETETESGSTDSADSNASPYGGETIEVIVPYGEGGGTDTWARALVPFLQKHLGDDVTVQAINMSGASGTVGAIEFAQVREHDGLSLLVSSGSNALPYVLGDDRVQYDFADFAGVMGSPVGGVVYVSAETGISSLDDLCSTDAELIYGGISPTGLDLVPLVAFEQMGLDFLGIMGYDGRGAARVAFEQGEVNLDYQTTPAFVKNVQPLVDEGSAVPLFAFGILDGSGNIAPDPVFPDLPTSADAIAACGGSTSGAEFDGYKAAMTAGFAAQKNLWVHGDAPSDRIDALNAAAAATIADAEFQAMATDLIGGYEFYAGAQAVNTAFGAASSMSDDAFQYLVSFLNDNYDAGLSGMRGDNAMAAPEVPAMQELTGAFEGQTIEVIVPYGEGGGTDTWARALVPFLQKHLGDDVTVQAINMSGASGTVGAIEFAQVREHDGLSLLVSSGSNALPYVLGDERVQYDFADFAGVMGSPVGGVVYVSADTGITSVEELCSSGEELIYGGISPTGLDLVPLVAFEQMGLDFLGIMGYDGRGAARVAFEQGEINLDYQTTPAFVKNVQPLVDEGSAVPLFAFGILDSAGNIAPDPVFPDMPTSADAIAACGGSTSGAEFDGYKAAMTAGFAAQKNLWVHGDAPADRIADLNAAAAATLADSEFQAIAADLIGGYQFYAGADAVNTAFGAASAMSDDAFAYLVSFLNDNYDAGLSGMRGDGAMAAPAMMEVTGAFAGETIEVIVPYGEGGGTDTWARALVPFLQKHLGDDVTVQAINMSGASGTVGAIEFAQVREHDGLSLLVSSGSNALPYVLGDERVQYDFADFAGVMGSPVGGVVYVSAETGITSVEDLCSTSEELIYGGISPTGLDLVPLVAFEQMGIDFLGIMGYDGRGAARVAFEQGEVNLDYQTTPAFVKNVMPLVDEGSAVPLFAFGILDSSGNIAPDPVFPDLPTSADAIAACGGATSGPEFDGYKAAMTAGFAAQKNLWVHGDAPADRIADLSAAAAATLADPEFQSMAADLIGGYEFYAGADSVTTAFGAASAMSDDAFAYLVDFLNENYDAGLSGER